MRCDTDSSPPANDRLPAKERRRHLEAPAKRDRDREQREPAEEHRHHRAHDRPPRDVLKTNLAPHSTLRQRARWSAEVPRSAAASTRTTSARDERAITRRLGCAGAPDHGLPNAPSPRGIPRSQQRERAIDLRADHVDRAEELMIVLDLEQVHVVAGARIGAREIGIDGGVVTSMNDRGGHGDLWP